MNHKNKHSNGNSNQRKNKKQFKPYVKYTNIAIQMIVIILLGVFGGLKLDEIVNLGFPLFIVLFSILSFVLAIYIAIKDFL